jgi:serine/threonine-protein kinase RsbW
MTHSLDEPCTTDRYPHDLAASATARRRMRQELRDGGLSAAVIEQAELVLGELIANAVEHGRPADDGLIEASWCRKRGVLHISVVDGGATVPDLRAGAVTADQARGRGLAIVDYLCENWTVSQDSGVRVTAMLTLA